MITAFFFFQRFIQGRGAVLILLPQSNMELSMTDGDNDLASRLGRSWVLFNVLGGGGRY